ncbi:ERI1 exoribonuclease 2-like [Panicum miliaceum]|uniref:ERI1 exoribonuclease 2-like n=1 Tax=Panicum miliaceum TaxID=4540 RepID=A0A3L6T7G7_PANMI|nr:ERI1 exoribonuclease 2-like [Panicum miliaceum]
MSGRSLFNMFNPSDQTVDSAHNLIKFSKHVGALVIKKPPRIEATCERDSRICQQEIIEFPAVLVHAATGSLVSSFRTYVRPRHNSRLTAFCSELTEIRQDQVDGCVDLEQALAMHDAWLAKAGAAKNCLAVVTWGDWDYRTMLEFECSIEGLTKPSYFNQWVNLRVPFEIAFGAEQCNLQEVVGEASLQ